MSDAIHIDNRPIGEAYLPYIVAELSANHNGDIQRAYRIMEAAKTAGADAIKLQSYTPDTLTIKSKREEFMVRGGLWDGKSLYELYEWAHMPWDWHELLFAKAKDLELTIFSSPFDFSAVDKLESLNTPAYKIASFELVDIPLIKYVAKTGKPIILSTGMANLKEIEVAIKTARNAGCNDLIVLHCVSGYPAPTKDYNLKTLQDLKQRFGIQIGLSDHTVDNTAAIASIALGACFIEKHVTLDRDGGGPDDSFSLEPAELSQLCESAKMTWQALGCVNYDIKESEQANLKFRRSLYVVKSLKKGELFSASNIRSIRPAAGLEPKFYEQVIGKIASQEISAGTPLGWHLINS